LQGAAAGPGREGRYAPAWEEGMYLFHQRLNQDLLAARQRLSHREGHLFPPLPEQQGGNCSTVTTGQGQSGPSYDV
jgi:hypothetical protein